MKKRLLIVLCLLLGLSLLPCAAFAEEAAPALTPEQLIAELNESIRIAEEKAEQAALEEHRKENGAEGEDTELKAEKNLAMQFVLLKDGRISLDLCEKFIGALAVKLTESGEEDSRAAYLELYSDYVKILPELQRITQTQVNERLPEAEVVVRLFVKESYEILLAQVEKGEVVFDRFNGIDTIGVLETPEESAAPAESAAVEDLRLLFNDTEIFTDFTIWDGDPVELTVQVMPQTLEGLDVEWKSDNAKILRVEKTGAYSVRVSCTDDGSLPSSCTLTLACAGFEKTFTVFCRPAK